MELNNIDNKKPVRVYHFDEFRKMKFNKFEVYLGSERPPYYYCNGEDVYPKLVPREDYDKYGLLVNKIIDLDEILKYSDWSNFGELIENVKNTEDFHQKLYEILRVYLEKDLYIKDKYFTLGDFQFTYVIDGEEIKLKVSRKKRLNQILDKLSNYLFLIYLLSVVTLCFINVILGMCVMFLPFVIYLIWVSYKELIDLRIELKYDRQGKNILFYYLIKLPLKIFLFLFFYVSIGGWFLIPLYFIYESHFYYLLLEILGGVIGISIWVCLYFFIMIFLGEKLLKYIDYIEIKIKSFFKKS